MYSILLFLIIGCTVLKQQFLENQEIEFQVMVDKTIVSSESPLLEITAIITNKSSSKLQLLESNNYTTSMEPSRYWNINVWHNDIEMISPIGYFDKARIYNSKDFITLNPGESKEYNFIIDLTMFEENTTEIPKFNNSNEVFGRYSLNVVYKSKETVLLSNKVDFDFKK